VKVYVVGGAIRDQLLGLPVKDVDYVVVGSSPEEMIKKGFNPVGQDFPVFLHPDTNQEYALARTERKVAPGYKGFTFHANPDVTLEQDLERRDLTVNAMAQEVSEDGKVIGPIIDPYGGIKDIEKNVLRHIGPAFSEDPVRLLRVARFSARFPSFTVAPETMILLRGMGVSGELKALVKERVWQEFSKGLMSTQPSKMFHVLESCQVFEQFFPAELLGAESVLKNLDTAAQQNLNISQRCAVLLASLEGELIKNWAAQWGIPGECKDYAVLASDLTQTLRGAKLSSIDVLDLLDRVDVWRKPDRFAELMTVIKILGYKTDQLSESYMAARQIDVGQIAAAVTSSGAKSGELIKDAIRLARLAVIKEL
jgi:tRNA nucleotidyltransferase (CCA-adding enzyme)